MCECGEEKHSTLHSRANAKMKTTPCQSLILLYLSPPNTERGLVVVFVNDCPFVRVKSQCARSTAWFGAQDCEVVPHYFFLRYCLAAIRRMKTVFVAPSTGVTLLFYPAGLTPTKEGRQPERTNLPLLIAAPHKLCFLLQLLIYSQKQRERVIRRVELHLLMFHQITIRL